MPTDPSPITPTTNLSLNEDQVRQLMDTSPDCVEILDLQGHLLWMNIAGRKIMKCSADSSTQRSLWLELWPSTDYLTSRTAFRNAIDRGVGRFTARQPASKHPGKWWDVSVTALLDHNGQSDKILSMARETAAPEALGFPQLGTRAIYRNFFEYSTDGAFQMDANGAAVAVNPALVGMLGWDTPEALIGEWPDFVFASIAEPAQRTALQAQLAVNDRAESIDYRLSRRDKSPLWVSLTIWAVRDEASGRLIGYEGHLKNNTFLRNAEHLIREQSHFINQAHDSIIVFNPETRITFWNQSAKQILGWSAGEILGRKISEFACFDETKLFDICNDIASAGQWRGELAATTKTGRSIVLDAHFSPIINDTGKQTACLCIASDITEKRDFEDRALHSQRLEGLGMLAAGIAHDLNNVLAPILMAVPMLSEHVTPAPARQLLDMMAKSAERGAGLVRQILSFANQSKGQTTPMDITPVIKDLSHVIQETFPKSMAYEYSIAPDLWMIKVNPVQLHQVLLNLCVNARDAMQETGTLKLTVENQVLSEDAAGNIEGGIAGSYVHFSIADSGPGIAPDVLQHIWEPFFSTKRPGKGTGLGLPTVRGIVEKHRGFISLDTVAGRGCTFHVWLPASNHPSPDDRGPPVLFKDAPQDSGIVLIVDDEPSIRELTHAALTRKGYRAHTAADGVEAVQFFTENSQAISLVITDLCMPNLDGWAMVKSIRQLAPDTKFIIISGSQGETPAAEALRECNAVFIEKPFAINNLLEQVDRLLQTD